MFDKQKYLEKCLRKLTEDFEKLEKLRNNFPEIQPIIDQCLEWYEEDNLNLYSIFRRSCSTPSDFYFFGNLHSFLVNTLLDDAAFKIDWCGEPKIEWATDNDVETSNDPKEILKVFDWYKKKDLERYRLEEEKIELLERLRNS